MRYLVEYDDGAVEEIRAKSDGQAERKAFEVAIEKHLPKPYRIIRVNEEGEEIKVIKI